MLTWSDSNRRRRHDGSVTTPSVSVNVSGSTPPVSGGCAGYSAGTPIAAAPSCSPHACWMRSKSWCGPPTALPRPQPWTARPMTTERSTRTSVPASRPGGDPTDESGGRHASYWRGSCRRRCSAVVPRRAQDVPVASRGRFVEHEPRHGPRREVRERLIESVRPSDVLCRPVPSMRQPARRRRPLPRAVELSVADPGARDFSSGPATREAPRGRRPECHVARQTPRTISGVLRPSSLARASSQPGGGSADIPGDPPSTPATSASVNKSHHIRPYSDPDGDPFVRDSDSGRGDSPVGGG